MATTELMLASSSPYRRQLLERLGLPFTHASPDIDETPQPNETPEGLAVRLANTKAQALAARFPGRIIIGSDQVAALPDSRLLNKPGNHAAASAQLARSSGQTVRFHTGLAVLDTRDGRIHSHCELFDAHFRSLTTEEIEHYLRAEQPYDCAGSFKMEGLGIALFRALEGRDPNSLIGLPLIALIDILRDLGLNPLTQGQAHDK